MQGDNQGGCCRPLYSAPEGRRLNPHAEGMSNLGTFSTTLLHNPPAPAGHNLRRSRAPFPFIFGARKAPPQPSRRRRVQPENLRPQSGRQTSAPCFPKESIKKAPSFESAFLDRFLKGNQPPNCASMVPAATAVPITPATFGPIACMSR